MTFKKTLYLAAAATFFAATGFYFIGSNGDSAPSGIAAFASGFGQGDAATNRQPIAVTATSIHIQTSYQEWRSYTGRAVAGRTSILGFELGGTLHSVAVDIGSTVKKGQQLASLDRSRLQANMARLKAEKASAEARLTLAENTLKRVQETYGRGNSSAQSFDEATANLTQARAQLNITTAAINALAVDLDRAVISAPYGGVITERLADEGRILAPGTPLFTLVETGRMEARIGVSQKSALALEKGAKFRLIDVNRNDIPQPKIRNILPNIEGQTRTRMTILTLPASVARDGDLITLLIRDEKQATGAWVPLRALSSDVRGLWRVNKISKDASGGLHVKFESVQILSTTGRMAFVSGTLSDGDQIIAGGMGRLSHNERVKIVETLPAPTPLSDQ